VWNLERKSCLSGPFFLNCAYFKNELLFQNTSRDIPAMIFSKGYNLQNLSSASCSELLTIQQSAKIVFSSRRKWFFALS